MIRRAKDIDEHTPWQEMTPAGEVYEAATARAVSYTHLRAHETWC